MFVEQIVSMINCSSILHELIAYLYVHLYLLNVFGDGDETQE